MQQALKAAAIAVLKCLAALLVPGFFVVASALKNLD
jgi:hypothetical protein